MKAVLMSIQPKWCELIASGKKTVEVRKTKPKLKTPFKCYIYCTNGKPILGRCLKDDSLKETPESDFDNYNRETLFRANGKVIGEFVCGRFTFLDAYYDTNGNRHLCNTAFIKSCVLDDELFDYLYGKHGRKHGGWAWHISDLVIYDKPRELGEFWQEGKSNIHFYYDYCAGCTYHETPVSQYPCSKCDGNRKYLYRPPQSWFYVEEANDGTES